jgi:hypothetical protein
MPLMPYSALFAQACKRNSRLGVEKCYEHAAKTFGHLRSRFKCCFLTTLRASRQQMAYRSTPLSVSSFSSRAATAVRRFDRQWALPDNKLRQAAGGDRHSLRQDA